MRPRVAVVGTFDVDNYGDHLFPRIAVRELARRLPDATVDCYAPFGALHPTRFTGGPPIHPLGPWQDDRLDAFAATYDAVLVGGGELLHLNDPLLAAFYGVEPSEVDLVQPSRWFLEGLGAAREASCPVLWHAIGVPYDLDEGQAARVRAALAHRLPPVVRDGRSRDRLLAAGVVPPVVVAPDSGLLVDRILDHADLESRRRRLGLPAGTLVVQGCDLLVPSAAAVAAAVAAIADEHGFEITLVETGRCRGDALFADAVGAELGGRPHHRLPADADLEDVAAVLASAAVFVGSSLHGAITALVHDRPFVLVNLGDESKLRGFVESIGLESRVVEDAADLAAAARAALAEPSCAGLVADLQAAVDAHFDGLASAIVEAMERRPADERPPAPPAELDRAALLAHVDTLRDELARARAEANAAAAEVGRIRASKSFRVLAPLRSVRARWLASRRRS
jgi:polysaccharide pyruvyl transferase WcaK-like protein